MADRPFVRVYHADLIRDYPDVWDDDAALAAWVRLLVSADGSWPAPAELPRAAKAKAVAILAASGLVIPEGSHRFRIKGMDAERNARADAARNAAAKRWHSNGNAKGNADAMPSRAEPSKAEPDRSEPNARDALSTYWTLMGTYPNGRTKTWIEELVNEFDDLRVSAALAAESKGDRQGLLGRTRDRLRSEADRTEKDQARAHTQRLEAEAAAKRITPEQAEANRKAVDAELAKMLRMP